MNKSSDQLERDALTAEPPHSHSKDFDVESSSLVIDESIGLKSSTARAVTEVTSRGRRLLCWFGCIGTLVLILLLLFRENTVKERRNKPPSLFTLDNDPFTDGLDSSSDPPLADGDGSSVEITEEEESGPFADPEHELSNEEDLLNLTQWLQTDALAHCLNQGPDFDSQVLAASCGKGYTLAKINNPIKVSIVGKDWSARNLHFSGCAIGISPCPLHPKCSFERADLGADSLKNSQVMLVSENDVNEEMEMLTGLKASSSGSNLKRVLFWSDPYAPYLRWRRQKELFDVLMGPYLLPHGSLINPASLPRPTSLLALPSSMPPLSFDNWNKRGFSLVLVSICFTDSNRELYLGHMSDYLGEERIHRYGQCAQKPIPVDVKDQVRLLSKYKFVHVLERFLQRGWVTPKLWNALASPVLPVYFGERLPFNVTLTPSMVQAQDFASPRDLAAHLLYLDESKEAYMAYHSWRSLKNPFTKEYLHMASNKIPGPKELVFPKLKHDFQRHMKRAMCCRLCNQEHIQTETNKRNAHSYIRPRWDTAETQKRLFAGASFDYGPGPDKRLKPASPDHEIDVNVP